MLIKMRKNKRQHSIGFLIITSTIGLVVLLVILFLITSYLNFNKNIKETTNVQTQEISRQIVYNYENYIDTIIETSNLIQVDIINRDVHQEANEVSDYLSNIIRVKDEIIRIDLYDEDGLLITSSEKDDMGAMLQSDESWKDWALKEQTIHNFSVPYEESGTYKIAISKFVQFNRHNEQGILKIEINFDNIIDLATKTNLGNGGFISIIDSNYNIVYSSKDENSTLSTPEEIEVLQSIVLGSKSTNIGKDQMVIQIDTLQNTKWRICLFNNVNEIMIIHSQFITTSVFISVIFIFISTIVLLGISRRITQPLGQLEHVMKTVESNEDFIMEEVHLTANKEVTNLSHGFNHMMKRIKELMDKVVHEQDEQRKSELKALQHQINPHFLYNTLDSIAWLVETNKNDKASQMVLALAKLFRISISKGRNIISIQDELEHAKNYLIIQNFRYRDTFDYEFIVDKRVLKYQTLKLILQPIIENSIYHGIKNRIDRGKITITVEKVDETQIQLTVMDNGYGMRQSQIDELYHSMQHESNSVGLKNVYQRLNLFYRSKAKVIIESELDEWTKISIIIPMVEEVGDDE